jgi:hypothetical protein
MHGGGRLSFNEHIGYHALLLLLQMMCSELRYKQVLSFAPRTKKHPRFLEILVYVNILIIQYSTDSCLTVPDIGSRESCFYSYSTTGCSTGDVDDHERSDWRVFTHSCAVPLLSRVLSFSSVFVTALCSVILLLHRNRSLASHAEIFVTA